LFGASTLALLAGLSACGDGSSNNPSHTPLTGDVTVTAKSGLESHTAAVSVTIP
jgi:hypothetical protein